MEVTDEHRAMVILDQESRAAGVDPWAVKGKRRRETLVACRNMVYWRLFRELKWGYQRIAMWFGRDRSTVFVAIKKMHEIMGEKFESDAERLIREGYSPRYYMDKTDTFGES